MGSHVAGSSVAPLLSSNLTLLHHRDQSLCFERVVHRSCIPSTPTDRRLWDPSTNAALQCSRRTFAARLDFLPQSSAAKERLEGVEWGLVLERVVTGCILAQKIIPACIHTHWNATHPARLCAVAVECENQRVVAADVCNLLYLLSRHWPPTINPFAYSRQQHKTRDEIVGGHGLTTSFGPPTCTQLTAV
jgi:hypothetical protein